MIGEEDISAVEGVVVATVTVTVDAIWEEVVTLGGQAEVEE